MDELNESNSRFDYEVPTHHNVCWAFVYKGQARINNVLTSKQLMIFEETGTRIEIESLGSAKILFGTAVKHPYPLINGYYSVHTNSRSLSAGEEKIRNIGLKLKQQGKI